MSKLKSLLWSASALTIGMSTMFVTITHAASSGNSEYVQNVDLSFPGLAAVIHVKNTSVNKLASQVKLQVQESSIKIQANGFVQCGNDKQIDFKEAKIYFGPLSMFVEDINDNAALYKSNYNVSNKTRIGLGKWVTEGTNGDETFTVPLNQIKNGHPALRVDALEEINKKLQVHLQGGGTKADFYKKNQEIVLQRPVSVAGWCSKYVSPGFTPSKAGFETQNFTIQVKYEGDPDITDKPILNAQLGGNLPNQLNQNLPLQLSKADFQPNMPHHIGKCLPDSNPKIRVNYSGTGKGSIRFKIGEEEGNFVIFTSNQTSYNSADQMNRFLDFNYPLIEKMDQDQFKWWKTINKTYNHSLTIKAQIKDQNSDNYGAWKDYGTAIFKHRCTPQVNIITSPGLGGYQGQEDTNKPTMKPVLGMKPTRGPLVKKTR
ncbi:hypothetical protein [Kiloniella sp.]|uniref:hypothetical protein n=1 Tax=Kiloniella sp. TaxID=1938587 RepID=UPI003B029339